jgi:folate-dependent phosphoribosylglycinamide formyltransferase PurN
MVEKMSRSRVVVLCGPDLRHLSTCATLLESNINVVGVCIANQKSFGLPIKYILKSAVKKGFSLVFGQILGRIYYNFLNKRKDIEISSLLYNQKKIDGVINDWGGSTHYTNNYSNKDTIHWLNKCKADIFIVHSGYWIDKEVRHLPRKEIIIGGHPGLIQEYRGSNSAFWAIYNGFPSKIGYSVFLLTSEIDAGGLIEQNKIQIEAGDSHVTLGWKGMLEIAKAQARIVNEFDRTGCISSQKYTGLSDSTIYDVPTLKQYLQYKKKQNKIR